MFLARIQTGSGSITTTAATWSYEVAVETALRTFRKSCAVEREWLAEARSKAIRAELSLPVFVLPKEPVSIVVCLAFLSLRK